MQAEPRYRLEVVERVFLDLPGCERFEHADPRMRAWVRRHADEVYVGTYHVEDGTMTIRENHVLAIGKQLGFRTGEEMHDLIQRIKRAGGEFLG